MTIFARSLATAEVEVLFSDAALLRAMLAFEAALAAAEAAEGVIPTAAAAAIAAACEEPFEAEAIVGEARRAGSVAIPLLRRLTERVAALDAPAAAFVHFGSTSQDVVDSACSLLSRDALKEIDADLGRLTEALAALARRHARTPMLGRTLLQPAQVIGFGFKVVGWLAPLLRARARLRAAGGPALAVQLGGAVGTLGLLGARGEAVSRRLAERLGLTTAPAAWHVQRDARAALGCELAILCGSLGKIGTDWALLAQAEVGELDEPSAPGRGGSSAMPNKRNPVAALIARSAALRAPAHAAALLAAMPNEHERGLGHWQAELAEWPPLLALTHGAVRALAEASECLVVHAARMRANIEACRGSVFAEAATMLLAKPLGKLGAQARVGELAARASAGEADLAALVDAAVSDDPALHGVDRDALAAVFDIDRAVEPAARLAILQLDALAHDLAAAPAPLPMLSPAPTP